MYKENSMYRGVSRIPLSYVDTGSLSLALFSDHYNNLIKKESLYLHTNFTDFKKYKISKNHIQQYWFWNSQTNNYKSFLLACVRVLIRLSIHIIYFLTSMKSFTVCLPLSILIWWLGAIAVLRKDAFLYLKILFQI